MRHDRAQGPVSVRSKERGHPSSWRHADVLREPVLALETARYRGFGRTLLTEYLARDHLREIADWLAAVSSN